MSKNYRPARRLVCLVGGPLDGLTVPNSDYFKEGDIEAVDTLEYCKPGAQWSPESVYRMKDGNLVYDPEATKKRAEIVANDKLIGGGEKPKSEESV